MDVARPLRLWLGDQPAQGPLGGAWWPYSRDLPGEVRRLLEDFPPYAGRLTRLLVSPGDWDEPRPPRQPSAARGRTIATTRGRVSVDVFPEEQLHSAVLVMGRRHDTRLTLLVVPPRCDDASAADLVALATSPANRRGAASLLYGQPRHRGPGARTRQSP